jgi:hypothetical protein
MIGKRSYFTGTTFFLYFELKAVLTMAAPFRLLPHESTWKAPTAHVLTYPVTKTFALLFQPFPKYWHAAADEDRLAFCTFKVTVSLPISARLL